METAKRKSPTIIHDIIIVSMVPKARHEIVFTMLRYPFSEDLRQILILYIPFTFGKYPHFFLPHLLF